MGTNLFIFIWKPPVSMECYHPMRYQCLLTPNRFLVPIGMLLKIAWIQSIVRHKIGAERID